MAPAPAPTVGSLLRDAAARLRDSGSESPRLDAELLLGHVLRADRATLLAAPEVPLSAGQAATFAALVERRAAGEPVAYIRGIKEFYGLALAVDGRALIPRPETELLVDLGVARVSELLTAAPRPAGAPAILAWDVGTGSGAVAVALAVECRRRGFGAEVRLLATDSSAETLALATENAVAHGVADAIDFAITDLAGPTALADLAEPRGGRAADVLLANLPYIPSAEVPRLPVAASYEPRSALDGGPDGLDLVRRLLDQLPAALGPRGVALLEIGADQSTAVLAAAGAALPGWPSRVHDDLSRRPRVVELLRPAP